MTKNTILQQLKRHESDLRKKGVEHIAVFGSYAREKAKAESEIDILIELDPNFTMDLFSYAGLKEHIANLFDKPVDVIQKAALKKELRGRVDKDATYAF